MIAAFLDPSDEGWLAAVAIVCEMIGVAATAMSSMDRK